MDFNKLDLSKYDIWFENSGLGAEKIELDDIDHIEGNRVFLKKTFEYVSNSDEVCASDEFEISFEDRDLAHDAYVMIHTKIDL